MSTFEIKKFAISSLGAIALSATCVLAAVGPVRAANAPLTTADWQKVVSDRISDPADPVAGRMEPGKVAETTLAIRFNAEGDYAGAAIARSSGSAAIDRHALAVANRVAYPPLPAGYRGRAQTVVMRLALGDAPALARHFTKTGQVSVDVASVAGAARIAAK